MYYNVNAGKSPCSHSITIFVATVFCNRYQMCNKLPFYLSIMDYILEFYHADVRLYAGPNYFQSHVLVGT